MASRDGDLTTAALFAKAGESIRADGGPVTIRGQVVVPDAVAIDIEEELILQPDAELWLPPTATLKFGKTVDIDPEPMREDK